MASLFHLYTLSVLVIKVSTLCIFIKTLLTQHIIDYNFGLCYIWTNCNRSLYHREGFREVLFTHWPHVQRRHNTIIAVQLFLVTQDPPDHGDSVQYTAAAVYYLIMLTPGLPPTPGTSLASPARNLHISTIHCPALALAAVILLVLEIFSHSQPRPHST